MNQRDDSVAKTMNYPSRQREFNPRTHIRWLLQFQPWGIRHPPLASMGSELMYTYSHLDTHTYTQLKYKNKKLYYLVCVHIEASMLWFSYLIFVLFHPGKTGIFLRVEQETVRDATIARRVIHALLSCPAGNSRST